MSDGNSSRLLGAIKRLTDKQFGFVRADDGQDYFFHYTELENVEWSKLEVGDRLSFLPVETPKGWRANEVRWEEPGGAKGRQY